MTRRPQMQLSLSDIARLAGVQRPVVSMWRRRPLAGHAFPPPASRVSGEERFDAREVADYLAATARGNNPEAADDLAAHAQLLRIAGNDEVGAIKGLTALLCLSVLTDEPLGACSAAELLDLARMADPADTFLLGEIRALGADVELLAGHADELASASYSASAAVERLIRRYAATSWPGAAATALKPEASALVARTARALAFDAGSESPLFVDVADGTADLLLAVADTYTDGLAPSVATLALDSSTARLARRRLRVHDLHRTDVHRDDAGDFAIIDGAADVSLHVLHLPSAGAPGMSDLEVLDAIDNLVVQLDDDSRAIVLGPASALTDRPATAELDRARDPILRSDRLRAVVRLPKGLLVRSPRQPLALWAFGPAHPTVAVRDRWTVVADVSDRPLDDSVIDGIVTDIVAAMTPDERSVKSEPGSVVAASDPAQVLGHQFRFARRVATRSLLLGRKSLVDKATRTHDVDVHAPSPVELAATVQQLIQRLDSPALDGLKVAAATSESAAAPARSTTVAQAVADGWLRALAGNRLRAEHLSTGSGGPRILGPLDVLGGVGRGARRVDLMTFAAHYPSGRLTEPGDIVVCTSPRVGAFVDLEGGSVVQTPARVLRITQAGRVRLLPQVVAADVSNPTAERVDDWRRWTIRVLTPTSVAGLQRTTAELDREREQLLTRLDAVENLASTLTDGAASGALTITYKPVSPKGP